MLASTLVPGGSGIDGFVKEWGLDRCPTGDDPKVLAALQTFLDTVSPEAGYVLSFAPEGTAATNFATKRVVVTSEALREAKGGSAWGTVSAGRAFRTTAGFVLHEVGHIRRSQEMAEAVARAYKGKPDLSLAASLSNILDENRIERGMVDDLPGLGSLFGDVIDWYAGKHPEGRQPVCYTDGDGTVRTRAEAFDVLVKSSRFDRVTYWGYPPSASVSNARAFGQGWSKRYTRDDTVATHLAGIRAAIEWLRAFPKKVEPEQEPEPEPGQGEGQDAEGTDEQGQGQGQGQGTSEPKPGERPTDLTIEGDEPDEGEGEKQPGGDKGQPADSDESPEEGDSDEAEDADAGSDDDVDHDDTEDEGSSSDGKGAADGAGADTESGDGGDESGADTDGDDEGEGSGDSNGADGAEGGSESESEDGEGGESDEGAGDGKVGGDSTEADDEPTLDTVPEVPNVDEAIKPTTTADERFDKRAEQQRERTSFDQGTALEGLGLTTIQNTPDFAGFPTTAAGGAPDAVAVDAMEEAFTNTRLSNETYGGGFQSGRFRRRSLQRILQGGAGSLNAFYRRSLPSITHLHLALVIDWSGSMNNVLSGDHRDVKANALAVNIATALERVNEVRVSIYHYTGDGQKVTRVWSTGDREDVAYAVTHVAQPNGGTPTAAALDSVANLLESDERNGEYTLIVSITDGEPNAVPGYADNHEPIRRVCDYWRRRGIGILGLGVGQVEVADIEDQYGSDAAVKFDGDWDEVGVDLTEVVGSLLNG